jgi:hypothetical protein
MENPEVTDEATDNIEQLERFEFVKPTILSKEYEIYK